MERSSGGFERISNQHITHTDTRPQLNHAPLPAPALKRWRTAGAPRGPGFGPVPRRNSVSGPTQLVGIGYVLEGGAVGQGQYPGKIGQLGGDVVLFSTPGTGAAALDVAIDPLNSLQITQWGKSLSVGNHLTIAGGYFALVDNSTISLMDNTNQILTSTPGLLGW